MNIYILKINKKYLNNILKYKININKIVSKDNYYYLYLNTLNYNKIKKIFKIYNIEEVGYKGLIKYKMLLKKYYLFLIFFVISISLNIFLSNIIFSVEINTNNNELKNFLLKELKNYKIDKYNFRKSYTEKEKIKNSILNDNKDYLEWLEITRVGCKYIVNVSERIKKDIDDDLKPRDVVARKNAIILSIKATNGSIIKKLNDYVKQGEVIVSGKIIHKDSVVNLVKSDAIIYGETWYTVHITYPITYYENKKTGSSKKRFSLTFLGKKINSKKDYKNEEIIENKIFYHKFLPIKLSKEILYEIEKTDDVLTIEEAYSKAMNLAYLKMKENLLEDSKILDQKKLKFVVKNSTIDLDVFFKVYENITSYQEIELEGE